MDREKGEGRGRRDENESENKKKEKVTETNMKIIKFVLQKSKELENKQFLISYFCLLYVIEKLNLYIKRNASDEEAKKLFFDCLTKAEKLRPTFSTLDEKELVDFCKRLFLTADKNDRTEKITKKTLQLFFTSQIFYDILNHFKTLDEDEKKKHLYAKYKTVYLKKCFDNNITPRPGTPREENVVDGSENDLNYENHQTEESGMYEKEQTENASHLNNESLHFPKNENIASYYEESNKKREDSFIDFAESLKHAQYAVNALMFEDKETSIKELKLSLSYLEQ